LGIKVPTFSSVLDTRIFAVNPALEYSPGALPSSRTGSNPVPVRSGLESSFRPTMAIASRPNPTTPGV